MGTAIPFLTELGFLEFCVWEYGDSLVTLFLFSLKRCQAIKERGSFGGDRFAWWWDGGFGQAGRFGAGFEPLEFPLHFSSQVTVWESELDVQ